MKIHINAILTVLLVTISIQLYSQNTIEYIGNIFKRNGKNIHINLANTPSFKINQKINLYKHFKQKLFGMDTTGWLHTAVAKVVKVNGKKIQIIVLEEKSKITVNNRRVDHFKPGLKVKVVPI